MQIRFSKKELQDLSKAWIAISLAFAIVLTGDLFSFHFLTSLFIAAITVGTGFLFHEMGHKVVAQRYGCWAEFRADNTMLIIALLLAFFLKAVFAAPGAVMIMGRVSKERNGKISLAGPAVNIAFAVLFLIVLYLLPQGFLSTVASFGFMINSWLALFNLIPFWILDGKKIFDWNKGIWGAAAAIAVFFVFLGFNLAI